ncbi:hypothetical protein MesoLj113b_73250 (plasmid) [Mesorhizobium sp. 113-3-3]|nr:hypothetical protein MesoLj113b_73250 [Mesorhizobium sp. 113-3-3]
MLTTSGVVGAWAYVATGSSWRAVAWGIIAAAVLQVGYFGLVFRMVYGRRDMKQTQKWMLIPSPRNTTLLPVSNCTGTIADKG